MADEQAFGRALRITLDWRRRERLEPGDPLRKLWVRPQTWATLQAGSGLAAETATAADRFAGYPVEVSADPEGDPDFDAQRDAILALEPPRVIRGAQYRRR